MEIQKLLGFFLLIICSAYGLTQACLGRPAFKLDYWIMVLGIFVSIMLQIK